MTGYLVIDNGEWWIALVVFDADLYDMVIPIEDVFKNWMQTML